MSDNSQKNGLVSILKSTYKATSGLVLDIGEVIQSYGITIIEGAGFSLGNSGGWSVSKSIRADLNVAQRGIAQCINFFFNKYAVGDTAGIYGYVNADGGVTAQSDEGVTGINIEVRENIGYFEGIVTSTSGMGDQTPKLAYSSGNAWSTDGTILLNITKGTLAASLNGPSSVFSGLTANDDVLPTFLRTIPVIGELLPLTDAWGCVNNPIPWGETTADEYTTCTLNVVLGKIGNDVGQFLPDLCVTIAGQDYVEQAKVIAIKDALNGVQEITVSCRYPNQRAVIFQGGVAGQYVSMDKNLEISGMRSSYYAFGSLTGSDLIGGMNLAGSTVDFTQGFGSDQAAEIIGSNSGFHLYPGAEVVCNPVVGFSPVLESNDVEWAVNDIVENPHAHVVGGHAGWFTKYQQSPTNASFGSYGIEVDVNGPGITTGFVGFALINRSVGTQYKSEGGVLGAPTAINIGGHWDNTIRIERGPGPGNALINLQNLAGDGGESFYILFCGNQANLSIAFNPVLHRFEIPSLEVSQLTAAAMNLGATGISQPYGESKFDTCTANHGVFSDVTVGNLTIDYDILSVRDVANTGIITANRLAIERGTPGSSSDTCKAGEIWFDGQYVYRGVATNTIERAPLSFSTF